MPDFELFTGELPYLTTGQMREVDRAMVDDFKICLVQMMENAGRSQARVATLAAGPKVLETLLAMCLRPLVMARS